VDRQARPYSGWMRRRQRTHVDDMALTSPQRNLVTAWHALAADGARFDGAALAPWPAPQTHPNVITIAHCERVSLMARGRCDGGHKTCRLGEAGFDSRRTKKSLGPAWGKPEAKCIQSGGAFLKRDSQTGPAAEERRKFT
jgi:hypothetical protein